MLLVLRLMTILLLVVVVVVVVVLLVMVTVKVMVGEGDMEVATVYGDAVDDQVCVRRVICQVQLFYHCSTNPSGDM